MADILKDVKDYYRNLSNCEFWVLQNMFHYSDEKLQELLETLQQDSEVKIPRYALTTMQRRDLLLHCFDWITGNHGVECVKDENVTVIYSNTGETYSPTLLEYYDSEGYGEMCFTSYGDIVESYMG